MHVHVPDELLTPKEVAAILRISPRTVRLWTRTGRLPALRLHDGRNAPIRIDPRDVERLVGLTSEGSA